VELQLLKKVIHLAYFNEVILKYKSSICQMWSSVSVPLLIVLIAQYYDLGF